MKKRMKNVGPPSRDPMEKRMTVKRAHAQEGIGRALEQALSECAVTFWGILGDHGMDVPEGYGIQFTVELVELKGE